MRAGIETESFAPIANAGREQVFPEYFAGNGGYQQRIDDDIDLNRLGAGIVGSPSGNARLREYIHTANPAHAAAQPQSIAKLKSSFQRARFGL